MRKRPVPRRVRGKDSDRCSMFQTKYMFQACPRTRYGKTPPEKLLVLGT